ncbi:C1q-like domain-containing protein [Sutcliffiella horikoshii]|uniref:C1q-like domain-containing protein n=1 Tax=Sutcliffiella horikoshii TaxID=79883 RepID=UPI003CF95854
MRNDEFAQAFRAINTEPQEVPEADTFYKVLFQDEQFDFGDIYNPNSSKFVPQQDGVYYVSSIVTFLATSNENPYRVRLEIRVNGTSVASDNDYWDEFAFSNAVQVSTVLFLEAGDLVEVFLNSMVPGRINLNSTSQPSFSTRFEASKFY